MRHLLRFNESLKSNRVIEIVEFYISNLYKDDYDLYKADFSDLSWKRTNSIIYFIMDYNGGSFSTQKGYINEDSVLFFQFVSTNIKEMIKLNNSMKSLPKILKDDEGIFSTISDFNYSQESEYYITLKVYLNENDYKHNTIVGL